MPARNVSQSIPFLIKNVGLREWAEHQGGVRCADGFLGDIVRYDLGRRGGIVAFSSGWFTDDEIRSFAIKSEVCTRDTVGGAFLGMRVYVRYVCECVASACCTSSSLVFLSLSPCQTTNYHSLFPTPLDGLGFSGVLQG